MHMGAANAGSLTLLADGSTPAGRELYAALLSKAVVDMSSDIQRVLDNKLSAMRVMLSSSLFIPQTLQRRRDLEKAKEDLTATFLPAALTAIRNYGMPISDVRETVKNYMAAVTSQIKIATSAAAAMSFSGFFLRVIREGATVAVNATSATTAELARIIATAAAAAVEQTATQATKNLYFGALVLGISIFGAAYVYRSFKGAT